MLFILTGDIQTGKTRWLERLIIGLSERGIGVQGVIAPGVWRSGDDPQANAEFVDANGFEKIGIDNVLLPQGERIAFSRRRDIALAEGLIDPSAQSEKAGLFWYMDDSAIKRVNEHLAALPCPDTAANLLVIDELGRLELLRGEGLVEALRLLEAGPTEAFPHALVIVRAALLEAVLDRFPLWGQPQVINANEDALDLLLELFPKNE